jgi:predicted naringenin-chalcone synthase
LLTDFRALAPAHELPQAASFEWLAAAHERAEATRSRELGRDFDAPGFRAHFARLLARFGCGEDKIASRRHELADCGHTRWSDMQVYRLHEHASGAGALARTQVFASAAEGALNRLFAEREPPSDLIHVTCTGYAAPSAAQRLVARRGWGDATRVVHAYHMGCYAAFPAIRIARGLLAASEPGRRRAVHRSDVVHTELCSLHMNPLEHGPEQLVVQTLFADGFVAYAVCDEASFDGRSPALRLLSIEERVLPDSSDLMSWTCSEFGMQMSLSREVPERLTAVLVPFVEGLLRDAGLAPEERRTAWYAVHPGGPRIVDRLQAVLELDHEKLAHSRNVLRERGNMSSATLPHIWLSMLQSREVCDERPIVSLAFGPGLTVCGAVLRKTSP